MQGLPQIESVEQVNLDSGMAVANVDAEDQAAADKVIPEMVEAVAKAGFKAEPFAGTHA